MWPPLIHQIEQVPVGPPVEVTVVAGVLEGQHPGLVQLGVGNRLARRVEFKPWFVFFAGAFDHDWLL